MSYCVVRAMYLIIIFPTVQCIYLGVYMNMELKLTIYMIFGLVALRYMGLPTNLLNNSRFASTLLSSLLSLVHVAIGVGVSLQSFILNGFKKSNAYFV